MQQSEERKLGKSLLEEADDCEHRYSPFELDGVSMWRCLRCGHVCEDEGEEEYDE